MFGVTAASSSGRNFTLGGMVGLSVGVGTGVTGSYATYWEGGMGTYASYSSVMALQ